MKTISRPFGILSRFTSSRMHGLQRSFCVSDEKVKNTLPYSLGGIESDKNLTYNNAISNILSTSMLKPGSSEGFANAYETLLSAIVEEDYEFIRSVCEPILVNHLLSAITDLKSRDLKLIKIIPTNDRVFNINFNLLRIDFFQPFDRSKQTKGTKVGSPPFETTIDVTKFMNPELMKMLLFKSVIADNK